MVKKVSGQNDDGGRAGGRKELHAKRLKLKTLHKDVVKDRNALLGLPPAELPPASSSNAARQARARLNITFPINWQDLHLNKAQERKRGSAREDGEDRQDD